MSACPHCGQDRDRVVQWKGLMVNDRAQVFWRGIRQPHLARGKAMILMALAARGRASKESLLMLSGINTTSKVVQVHICHLRRWLKANGIGVGIVTEYGFGYALEEV